MLFNYASILLFSTILFSGLFSQSSHKINLDHTQGIIYQVLEQTGCNHMIFSYAPTPKSHFIYKLVNIFQRNHNTQTLRLTHVNIQAKVQLQFGPNIAF